MNDVPRRRPSKVPEPDLLQTLASSSAPESTEPLPRARAARSGTFGVLDVGTTKVCCLIGRTDPDGTMRVIGSAMRASRGVRAGGIVDLDAASHSIAGVVGEAEDKAGQRIEHYWVNLSCGQPESRLYTVEWPVGGRAVTEHDLRRVVQEGGRRALLAGREIIHVVPLMFAVDETQGVLDPRRMHCDQLKARLHVIDAAASAVHNLMATIGRCKLQLEEFVSSPLASGLATLVEDERQLGTTVIDMGGGTTGMAVFSEGQLLHTAHLRIGGLHITKDIAQGLSTPLAQAERLKTLYGSAQPSPDDEREMLPISLVGEEEHDVHKIPRSRVISIIVPRLEETFEMVRAQLDAAGVAREAGHRVVLTGGASQMPGLRDMATRMLGGQVRLGKPAHLRGLPDLASGPAFATASGLLAWASGAGRQLADVKLEEDGPPTLLARIVKYIGDHL
ncbi:MAG: cell division protein FtsA [Acetobacteraceae bacterium]|nr:cell division protein FtsA [Acetobacteraceae bacterium]